MVDFTKPIPSNPFLGKEIRVVEPSNEQMVYLNDYFICDSMYNHWVEDNGRPLAGSSPYIMARETILKMLQQAEQILPLGYRFKIYDAYRPIAVQQALWDYFRAKKAIENPGKTPEEIDIITLYCVSIPSYNILIPSLHNTGGAVDLTLIDDDDNELYMGCNFDEFTDKAWVDYFETHPCENERDEEAKKNRRILYNAMLAVGFTNFPSEWWHFDYGDEMWAGYARKTPIYAGILDAKVRDSVPYTHMEEVREMQLRQEEAVRVLIASRQRCAKLNEQMSAIMRQAVR